MSFLSCLPLIAADIPAVLALDQRCLGGLWTKSGYQKELESDCSDLCVLVSSPTAELIHQRQQYLSQTMIAPQLAASDPNTTTAEQLRLLGVGCLWAILEEAHITTLAIEPGYQGQKLGLLLLTHLLAQGRARGLERATLEVRISNQSALNLYQKFDFKAAGERKRYYADGENARILWRSGLQNEDCGIQITQQRQCAIAHIQQQGKYTVLS